ncbi:hypothetical protein H5410_002623 [Solanum commersonii]|uniref:Uncharacterized protein n=1 Tax=Solanum commersonii TaxID=4109 RepID=A0A9J6B2T6_SOLCO|nr:hypothetical protein H5410_002623 [Solanum commersonii]
MGIRDSSSDQSYVMVGTPPLTQYYVHPGVSHPSPPVATLDETVALTVCTWKPRCNMVIAITFEKRTSTRLCSGLKKVCNIDQCPTWMLPRVFDELRQY